MTYRIALTPGEPAGIGPDLCVQLAQQPPPDAERVVVADPALLSSRAKLLGYPLTLNQFDPSTAPSASRAGELTVLPVDLAAAVRVGKLDPANAEYVLNTLSTAVDSTLAQPEVVTASGVKACLEEFQNHKLTLFLVRGSGENHGRIGVSPHLYQ